MWVVTDVGIVIALSVIVGVDIVVIVRVIHVDGHFDGIIVLFYTVGIFLSVGILSDAGLEQLAIAGHHTPLAGYQTPLAGDQTYPSRPGPQTP